MTAETRPGYYASPRDQWVADEVSRAGAQSPRAPWSGDELSTVNVHRREGIAAANLYLHQNAVRAGRRGTIRAGLALGVIAAGLVLLAVGAGL